MQIPQPVETGTSEMSSQEGEHSWPRKLQADFPSQHSGQAVRECSPPTTWQLLIWQQSNFNESMGLQERRLTWTSFTLINRTMAFSPGWKKYYWRSLHRFSKSLWWRQSYSSQGYITLYRHYWLLLRLAPKLPWNHKQFVTVNGSNSDLLEIDTGVPQGSLLGSRL